ncbi:MAG: rhodanese-like domain-containing protein [Bacteroidota bacterium]
MNKTRIWMLAILFISFAVVSCNKEEEDPINEAEILIEYLESMDSPLGKDYVNTDMAAIKVAEHVRGLNNAGKVYIVDIRSAESFATGHIENANNVAAGDVLTHLDAADLSGYDEISIVCYSGQTAGWVTSLLRIAGYDNVYSMKWGMCSWHEDFAGSWPGNISNGLSALFESDSPAKDAASDLPTLSTGKETGQEILESRLSTTFAEGFAEAKVSNTEVFANLDDYYIINYWAESDYTHYGHVPGAIQYTPKETIKLTADLKTLPADKTVVVYCWTGQTSANMAAYLRLIGYDAKSLLFGANGMIYDDLESHKWSDGAIMGYEYVTD